MENNNEISKLQKTCHGTEDDYMEKHIITPYKPKMKYYGTFFLEQINENTYLFPKINLEPRLATGDSEKFVYKNLKSDTQIEDSCQLIQNGKIIDMIDGEIFSTLRLLYGISDNNILPFSFCKENNFLLPSIWNTKLIINANKNINSEEVHTESECNKSTFNISVDIYEIVEDCDKISDMVITQIQSLGAESISKMNQRIGRYRLCFQHIMSHIIIHLPKGTINKFLIQINGMDLPITISNMKYHNDQYVITLTNNITHGINFSNINHASINIWFGTDYEFIDNDYMCIYGISYNGIKINTIKPELVFN